MATTQLSAGTGAANRTGLYLAVLQLAFTLGWTTYVVHLPKLAAEVGIAPSAVIFILMLDQAIFTIADTVMGIAADKIAPHLGRLGLFVGLLAAISCGAFIALPFVAGRGVVAQGWFIALIVVWSITSSALRAPPLTLLGRYRARPQVPFLAALAMLGYGVAGAVSPYLGVVLREHDARLPFVISSAVLLLTALGLSRIEHDVARDTAPPTPAEAAKPLGLVPIAFIVAMVALALGYQLHFALNSAPFYLRFAKPDELQWLMPVFWIGFNIAMFPASLVVKHRGGVIVMGAAGLLGAVAIAAAEFAGSLNTLIVAQFLAGAAWGCMLMSAISAALAIGSTGAEGKVTGLVFSALALGTFARMAAVAGGLQKMPDYAPLLHWAPVACWAAAGAGLLVIAAARLQGGVHLKASAGG
ncbi:MFS transporter [Bradyrhizobium sp. CSS354]|uniref:MFS transporter n=1 Tax=Bradyrhizobium sp. CSS354 TaxID=2699172 RepID=UPI0023B00F6F|nr:MFS transporter [Bradyrhizobium sp. CSS354]MDE5462507.1 MFS transporter [Bradyrhizobium sp. CSS354]